MSNCRCNVSWVTNIEGHIPGYILCIMQSSIDYLSHQNWKVIISLVDFDWLYIPLPGPSVVPSCYHLNTRFTFGIGKICMKVPINCCQLLPSFIHSITNGRIL